MGRRQSAAAARAVELVGQGMTRAEAARQTGMSIPGVSAACKRAGLSVRKSQRDFDRAERMATMYRQGLTLVTIGEHFNITRERVRQILKAQGLVGKDGGQRKRTTAKVEAQRARMDATSLARWGISHASMQEHRKTGLLRAFINQRRSAAARGIGWELTFAVWLEIWRASGKLDQRGRGKGKYVMSRIKDGGSYEVGNVHIQLATENSREAVKQWLGVQKAHRGVHCLYQGTPRPYVVKVQKKQIGGQFETAEAAAAFRAEYIRANNIKMKNRAGSGKGWTLMRGCRTKPYMVQAMGKRVGYFATQDEAEAAYRAYVESVLIQRAA